MQAVPPFPTAGQCAKAAASTDIPHPLVQEAKVASHETTPSAACIPASWCHGQWKMKNQLALESSNTFVERMGLPLARYRNF